MDLPSLSDDLVYYICQLKFIKLVMYKHVCILRTKPYINGAFVNIREALFPLDRALRGPPATDPVAGEDGRVTALLDRIQVHCNTFSFPAPVCCMLPETNLIIYQVRESRLVPVGYLTAQFIQKTNFLSLCFDRRSRVKHFCIACLGGKWKV